MKRVVFVLKRMAWIRTLAGTATAQITVSSLTLSETAFVSHASMRASAHPTVSDDGVTSMITYLLDNDFREMPPIAE